MKIEIKCRFGGAVLFSHEQEENTLPLTVEAAVKARANLAGANLDGASLDGANLARASLAGASLDGANLDGASLDGASLARASLAGASLDGANLARASLAGAYLAGAYLAGASLDGEALTKAPLSVLNLTWPVLITEGYMRIGCQRHTHEEWRSFDDAAIAEMEPRAADFWGRWGQALLAMCDAHKGGA